MLLRYRICLWTFKYWLFSTLSKGSPLMQGRLIGVDCRLYKAERL